jgi:hypothetical protein
VGKSLRGEMAQVASDELVGFTGDQKIRRYLFFKKQNLLTS